MTLLRLLVRAFVFVAEQMLAPPEPLTLRAAHAPARPSPPRSAPGGRDTAP